MEESEVRLLAKNIREELAEKGLSPAFAKLYSQHTRLQVSQTGLAGWRHDEAYFRLHDAMRLIAVAFLEKESGVANWQNGLRRAGELLEWLSHSELNPENLPIQFLASAAYQLAGYPARALGLLNQINLFNGQSRILYFLLRSNFRGLFEEIRQYWELRLQQDNQLNILIEWSEHSVFDSQLQEWITDETIRAFGILCSMFRWGDELRLENAVNKLNAIAKVLLHGKDPYSWLLAKLCAEVVAAYVQTSMRSSLTGVMENVDTEGKRSIERYLRQAYLHSKALAWPSQIRGINELDSKKSFALCTPTGSGKTTIAEIAILQNLFSEEQKYKDSNPFDLLQNRMILYLVPTKALASEVEAHLSKAINYVGTSQIVVSSLYGGTDWGPTDAWLTSNEKAVLICTYEKAEALIRFLGSMFLNRVSLVVIDEAHSVQFDGNKQNLWKAESRSLRLETLGNRLISLLRKNDRQILALSAVASGIENVLANWVQGNADASPVQTTYRSTRQLLGRLECLLNNRYEIRYDLLDGEKLQFEDGGINDTPFIPNPFPPHPPAPKWHNKSAELSIRPHLFWAAMHLATPDHNGHSRSVLISISSQIGGYANDFLELLDVTWRAETKPNFFTEPTEPLKIDIWQQCLRSCGDYFTKDSPEYKLLRKGVILHHGKMPGLLARLLIQAIQERIVNIVLATSTLSEGVNLPFETVLIPSLRRYQDNRWQTMDSREFGNLTGRAGRPGFGTEGRSLILLPIEIFGDSRTRRNEVSKARQRYFSLIAQIQQNEEENKLKAVSPLAELLGVIEKSWVEITGSNDKESFIRWLEQVTPVELDLANFDQTNQTIIEAVDSLDSIILASIVELEQISENSLSVDELEEQLKRLWQNSYAHYASARESQFMEFFVKRGCALREKIYPQENFRRKLYRTSLPPRTGNHLLMLSAEMREHLQTGAEYAAWSIEQRIAYIQETVHKLGSIARFKPKDKTRSGKVITSWQDILRWWLAPNVAIARPSSKQVSTWHSYISQTFHYRVNWGLGSIIALLLEESYGDQPVTVIAIEDWLLAELPWIVFWMKDLIVWGTLDPVAAYLLSRRMEITRPDAESAALSYYSSQDFVTIDETLNAKLIKQWADSRYNVSITSLGISPSYQRKTELLRDFSNIPIRLWRVIPVEKGERILWIDPGGYPLAISAKEDNWDSIFFDHYDFNLDVKRQMVISQTYS